MNALPVIIGSLCIFVLAYRFYASFIAAKVLVLDDKIPTPAHAMSDGQNYFPTNKWVLFGHHFAAIAGAGPLIGPVLAAQFGYLPGLLWILIGSVLAGAVHDLVVLFASIRHKGKSLAEIAGEEVGFLSGITTAIAVIFIIVIALAGLGLAVVNSLKESSWGVFTIGCSVPIALFMGLYMYRFRKGKIKEATVIGVTCLVLAVIFGKYIPESPLKNIFTMDKNGVTLAIVLYGFIASVLPVWMLLCPRDYLSTYMKLGTIAFLTIGIIIVHPNLEIPAVTQYIHGGGPIIPGHVFPFVCITIACGAISGFHSLIGSGTTPKMIGKESDALFIGYGAMIAEAFVSLTALIAACALVPADYFAINVSPEKFATLGLTPVHLNQLSAEVGENIAGRPGGAVSLAVGMAQIFSAIPGLYGFMSYWYHFAIMFEALFILTTIDTGTRVARFLFQEAFGKIYSPFSKTDWMPGTILCSALVVLSWGYFIYTGNISTIWPMFGIANQLLSAIALCIGTTIIIKIGKARYMAITLVPMIFMCITTISAGYLSIRDNFLPIHSYLNILLTVIMIVALCIIIIDSLIKWSGFLSRPQENTLAVETVEEKV
ncbi:MAG: carbon starvation protein A [Candidatus Eremiobacterota bacterium]